MKRKGLILGVLAAAAIVCVTIGSTMAYMKTATEPLTNYFTVGSVETEIVEGKDGFKNPQVKNLGDNECYVRVRVLITPAAASENVELTDLGEGWTLKEDGYYYYEKALETGDVVGAITTPVFKSIRLKEGVDWLKLAIGDFEVIVYEESVQTVAYADGKEILEPAEIWKLYEAETK